MEARFARPDARQRDLRTRCNLLAEYPALLKVAQFHKLCAVPAGDEMQAEQFPFPGRGVEAFVKPAMAGPAEWIGLRRLKSERLGVIL